VEEGLEERQKLGDLNGFYRGVVVDTADPKKKGRVRVRVFAVMEELTDTDKDSIPWAVPAQGLTSGGAGIGFGVFSVPQVDSFVFVFFEAGDPFQPVYFAEATDGVHGQPTFKDTNYPDRRGFRLKNGVEFFVDEVNDLIKLTHPSGTEVTIDESGKVAIKSTQVEIGSASFKKLVNEAFQAVYNSHTHVAPGGGGPTSAPSVLITPSELTQETKAS